MASAEDGIEAAYKYDIAFSFAGEDRAYVEAAAKILQERDVSVFYDKFEEASLWGKNLYEYLHDLYSKRARYTVIFISSHHSKKLWTNHEKRAAQERAFLQSEEYILPARFDDTELPGIGLTIGYIDLRNHEPISFTELILRKLELAHHSTGAVWLSKHGNSTVEILAKKFMVFS